MDSEKILKHIAECCHVDKTVLEVYFHIFIEEMMQALKGGNDITIAGFGDFSILVPEDACERTPMGGCGTSKRREIRFVPSKEMEESLNRW